MLIALLRMLRDVAVSAADQQQGEEIRRQAELITLSVSETLIDQDVEPVVAMRKRVDMVLGGDLEAAYSDRAGETRSL